MSRIALIALAAATTLAGCGIGARSVPVPSPVATPAPSIPLAIDQTRFQVEGALRAAGFFLERARDPFRPPESPALAAAPRVVFNVLLPDDPGRGRIVVYEFADTGRAASAGREMAAYLASGPGRIQFPSDARHVLRQLGTTLIFYSWSREGGATAAVETVARVLDSVGEGIAVPL